MTAISKVAASERAKRYRELAREARAQAARSRSAPRHERAYLGMAGRWEELALEADVDAEAEHAFGDAPTGPASQADASEHR